MCHTVDGVSQPSDTITNTLENQLRERRGLLGLTVLETLAHSTSGYIAL